MESCVGHRFAGALSRGSKLRAASWDQGRAGARTARLASVCCLTRRAQARPPSCARVRAARGCAAPALASGVRTGRECGGAAVLFQKHWNKLEQGSSGSDPSRGADLRRSTRALGGDCSSSCSSSEVRIGTRTCPAIPVVEPFLRSENEFVPVVPAFLELLCALRARACVRAHT